MSNESMKKTSEKQSVTCHYDGLGKRRIKAVGDETHYWRWDAGYSVVAEYKDQTPDWDVGALQRFFVPFGHTALAETTPGAGGSVTNGTYTYLAHDHLGTSRNGYNQSQTEIHSNEHLPFGQRFSTTGTVPYHEWTGKPWDADTQMYYFPYRYYSPMMNRWTAADPLGMVDGPNMYGYVGGNPIMHIDPEGGFPLFAGVKWAFRLTGVCLIYAGIMALNAYKADPGRYSQHCVFGCYLAKCTPPKIRGWLAYSANWHFEELTYWLSGIADKVVKYIDKESKGFEIIPHDPMDDEAAVYGTNVCSQSECPCEDCCMSLETNPSLMFR